MDHARLASLHRDHVAHLSRHFDAALRAAELDAVVLHSGSARKRSEFDDQYWPLRPVPHFQHWAPLAQADCAIVVAAGKKPKLLWLKAFDFWEQAPKLESDHFLASFEVIEIARVEDVKSHLPAGKIAFVGEDASRAAMWGVEAVNPPKLVLALDAMRVTKTPYEVLCLEEANRRAAKGHHAVLNAFRAGDVSELEMHLEYLRATEQDDPETPYKNIVAVGANAATLHHVHYVRHASEAPVQSLLLDAGATFQGYCSDITRTWVRGSGATASAFEALVFGVEKMQHALCAKVTVGQPYESLHDETHHMIAEILRDVGVAKSSASAGDLVSSGVTRVFLPHGLGHSLGLQCHDVGCALVKPKKENPFLRNTSPVTEGQAFTIEPGIYFIEPLLAPIRQGEHASWIDWSLVDALAPLGGIRIEDDLVVTGGSQVTRNLTREHLPVGGGR